VRTQLLVARVPVEKIVRVASVPCKSCRSTGPRTTRRAREEVKSSVRFDVARCRQKLSMAMDVPLCLRERISVCSHRKKNARARVTEATDLELEVMCVEPVVCVHAFIVVSKLNFCTSFFA
jgi:hypothetical protein